MGILDILQGNPTFTNDPGVTNLPNPALWGALNQPSPLQALIDQIKGQPPTPQDASAYGSMGVDPSATYQPAAPQSPFPQQPQQPAAPTPPPSGFGATAPFSFGGPGSMNVNPATIAPPPQPAPQVASVPAPQQPPAAPAPQSGQAAPIAVGSYQMPRIGSADDFEPDDDIPANAKPAQGTLPAGSPQPAPFSLGGAASGIGDRLGLATKGFLGNMASGPIGALAGGLGALVTGKPTDAGSIAAQKQNATVQALVSKGAPVADVQAAVGNPELMQALINQYYGKDKFTPVETTDALGRKTVTGAFNSNEGTVKQIAGGAPAPGASGVLAPGMEYDPNKSGDAYMAQFSPEVQAAAKAYINGDVMPTGNARNNSIATFAKTVAQKYGMDTGAPVTDATYGAKRKMQVDLASSGNSTMGGILSNGESSFKHLAEYTASAADQGNASHNFPGGGAIAHVQNYVGNTAGGSDAYGKVKAINDNLGKYGAESTKFYAGTGGGVEERLNALKEMNATTTSGEEAAAYAEKEKGLMLDRLNTKFQEIRNTLGDERGNAEIAKHMPDIQRNIAMIDANVAKLRGAPTAGATPGAAPALPSGWSVQVH